MATNETKTRIITLTYAQPVKITEDQWPQVASGNYHHHDGEIESQAIRVTDLTIRVRQHKDGRALVYGLYSYSSAYQNEPNAAHRAGVLLEVGGDIIAAIKEVGETLVEHGVDEAMVRDVVAETIADLPAREI